MRREPARRAWWTVDEEGFGGGRQDRHGRQTLVWPRHHWRIRFSFVIFADAENVSEPEIVRQALNMPSYHRRIKFSPRLIADILITWPLVE
eukprot:1190446-Prorocentrum_minimum.AAC.3